jgi:predicted MPP superfamily phosphohydrolase
VAGSPPTVPASVDASAAWAARMAARRAHASWRPSLASRRHGIELRRFAGPATYRDQVGHLRIAHLTDQHVGRITPVEVQLTAVEMTNAEKPDLILLSGDFVCHSQLYLDQLTDVMRAFDAPVIAVLGNHDHWVDAQLLTDLFRAEGITVLINEGMRFEKDGAAFWLAGVDDTMVGLEDLSLALAGARSDEMKLVLAHNPIVLRRAARASVDLVLSGHTHGGQVAIRGERNTLRGARKRLLKGLGRLGNTQIYVNRGLGTVVLPIRYGCPPEISLLELRSG